MPNVKAVQGALLSILMFSGLLSCHLVFPFPGGGTEPTEADGTQIQDQGLPPPEAAVDLEPASPDQPTAPTTQVIATASNDTCSTALTVDLSLLNKGAIEIVVDSTRAGDDYSFEGCAGFPDVAIKLENVPGLPLRWDCTGEGIVALGSSNACGVDPAIIAQQCLGGVLSFKGYLIICVSSSPIRITIQPQKP